MSSPTRRANQRGSALLIVFVFAAALAIMLYREMPVVAFEAQRQKEELLIDRGNEYKRAIKLYVRKFQTFPASMEALENTNRMRFLRNRYIDPFTGKDDWRVLHAGPGGMIIDSKIKPKTITPNGAPNAANAATTANGNTANSSSAATSSTDATALSNGQPAEVNSFPQRPPAVSIDGGNPQTTPGLPLPGISQTQPADQQSTPPIPTAGAPYPGYPGPPIAPIPGQGDASVNGAQVIGPDGNPVPVARSGRFRNANPSNDPNAASNPGAVSMGNSQNPQAMMQALLNNNNPQPTAQTGVTQTTGIGVTPAAGTGSFNGAMNQGNNTMGGGIAGVASKAAGHTIKVINEQTNRALWEFVYDMQKELMANAPGINNNNAQNGSGTPPSNGMGMNSSFNSPAQTNSFGGSSFGNSSSQTPPAPPQQSLPNQ